MRACRAGETFTPTEPHTVSELDRLPRWRLEAMAAAGRDIRECYRVLAKTGDNVVGEILRGQDGFYEWNHYPDGDVYDHETHAQYYYHAHPAAERSGEHGHFHTFLRARGMPSDVRPARVPGGVPASGAGDAPSHIVAISMDAAGFPIRLFTTNRWVTGEVWYEAADVCRMLDAFRIDHAQPSWPTNRWITGMVALFRPQIEDLVRQRDAAVRRHAAASGAPDVYEDRTLDMTSSIDIDVERQLAAVERALARAA